VVDIAFGEIEKQSGGIAAITAVRKGGPVKSMGKFQPAPRIACGPTDMLRVNVLQAVLGLKIRDDLEVRDHGGACAFGNGYRIAQVIPMAVSDKNVIRVQIVRRDIGDRVACQKGINKQFVIPRLDQKRGMAEPGQFTRHDDASD